MKTLAVIGGGWAGLATAVQATADGHQVTLFESAPALGGRAKTWTLPQPGNSDLQFQMNLDPGQHLLRGTDQVTLSLLRQVGVDPDAVFLRLPLQMHSRQQHLTLSSGRAPWHALWGVLRANGWRLGQKWRLLEQGVRWQRMDFRCGSTTSVQSLCHSLPADCKTNLMLPLCQWAMNTLPERASGQVFLNVLRDTLWGQAGSSDVLIPRVPMSHIFPMAALDWLSQRGARIELNHPVQSLQRTGLPWTVDGQDFEHVVLACPAPEAARLLMSSVTAATPERARKNRKSWSERALRIEHNAISTVYLQTTAHLPYPMMVLPTEPTAYQAPAHLVFDRGQLGGPSGLLAFVVGHQQGDAATLTERVMAQAAEQFGPLNAVHLATLTEPNATFACTAGQTRPSAHIAPGLTAAGDYVDGPYPSSIEGAVRSGLIAAMAVF